VPTAKVANGSACAKLFPIRRWSRRRSRRLKGPCPRSSARCGRAAAQEYEAKINSGGHRPAIAEVVSATLYRSESQPEQVPFPQRTAQLLMKRRSIGCPREIGRPCSTRRETEAVKEIEGPARQEARVRGAQGPKLAPRPDGEADGDVDETGRKPMATTTAVKDEAA